MSPLVSAPSFPSSLISLSAVPLRFPSALSHVRISLFLVGAVISVFTGRSMAYSGFRMVGIGALAAGVTFGIGKLLGVSMAG